jgi:hypothetical protein
MRCNMTADEFEQRKLHLEEELRAGVELLETAFRHQLRALELVRAATGGEIPEVPRPTTRPEAPVLRAPAAPARAPRLGTGVLLDDVRTALAGLSGDFDRNAVCAALGYEPERSSLYRILQGLVTAGQLSLARPGSGKVPTLYRKPHA